MAEESREWNSTFAFAIIFIVLLAGAGWYLWQEGASSQSSATAANSLTAGSPDAGDGSVSIHTTPGVESWYTNAALHFSFRLPDGFMAPDAKSVNVAGAHAAIVYNKAGDELLVVAVPQSVVTGGGLSLNDIRNDSPGEVIGNATTTSITGIPAIEFATNAKEWGGNGIGLWFLRDGYRYELMTYRKDAALLEYIRETWQFAPPAPPPIKR